MLGVRSDVIDRALPPLRARPLRFYSYVYTGGALADWVLHVREWWSHDPCEPPVESYYAVQEVGPEETGDLSTLYLFVRLSPLPRVVREFDDAGDWSGELVWCRVPYRPSVVNRGRCECRGFRTFARCRHHDAFLDITGLRSRP